jgi:sugar O-acyltransferase (sialic acid O-acetyltransferase NeuD family)
VKKLAIIGAGGHGRVVADAAEASGWERIDFFDNSWPEKKCNAVWDVVGDLTSLKESITRYDGVIVAIGNNKTRLQMMRELELLNPYWVNIIHPRAILSTYVEMGMGVVVFAGAVVNAMTKIGDAVIINTGATVDHDCVLSDGTHISPGVNLAGGVLIGQKTWIGIGSAIKENIQIGCNVTVGAGSVVIKDISDNQLAYGAPASVKGIINA